MIGSRPFSRFQIFTGLKKFIGVSGGSAHWFLVEKQHGKHSSQVPIFQYIPVTSIEDSSRKKLVISDCWPPDRPHSTFIFLRQVKRWNECLNWRGVYEYVININESIICSLLESGNKHIYSQSSFEDAVPLQRWGGYSFSLHGIQESRHVLSQMKLDPSFMDAFWTIGSPLSSTTPRTMKNPRVTHDTSRAAPETGHCYVSFRINGSWSITTSLLPCFVNRCK